MGETAAFETQKRSRAQRTYEHQLVAVLLNLTVLGLFDEHWEWVEAGSFTILLVAAMALQLLLRSTLAIEDWSSNRLRRRPGGAFVAARILMSWLILAGSKFVMLAILTAIFGNALRFGGPHHGAIAFVVVVLTMLLTEQFAVRTYRALA